MGYTDINAKALGFAESGIRERQGKIYLKNKVVADKQAECDRLTSELMQEEENLRSMQEDILGWEQDNAELAELIALLKKPRDNFDSMSDEKFEARRKQLRWEIADVLGYYTFIADGSELDVLGGF